MNDTVNEEAAVRWRGALRSAAVAALALALYLPTLAPTVYNLDSAELTTAAATGGLMRATGYPLYLLLGRFWVLLPIGDAGYRMNLLSAVCSAATLVLAERVLRRLGVGVIASFGALGLLACGRFYWALSVIAEVYTLHTALLLGLLLALLRWRERPGAVRLLVVAVIGALGCGNHMATVLLLPGVAWFLWARRPRPPATARTALVLAAGVLLVVLQYLYLAVLYRERPAFNYAGRYDERGELVAADLTTARGLLWLVGARRFEVEIAGHGLAALPAQLGHAGAELWRAFLGFGIGPGALGWLVLWRRDRRLGAATSWMFAANLVFFANYRVVDRDTMFLPVYVVWAIWLGVGYQWLLDWLVPAAPAAAAEPPWTARLPWARAALAAAILGAVVVAGVLVRPLVDQSEDWSTRRRGEQILRLLEPGALLVGRWATAPVVEYLQLVEGERTDVRVINRFLIDETDLARLVGREIERRPVYFDDADVPAGLVAEPVGPLVRLRPPSGAGSSLDPR